MDMERAKEILNSPEKIEVKYRGTPVWIEMIDETAEKAQVHSENNPDDVKIVPVWDLDDRK
ncbi:H-type small acid-soluble spore protein [Thermoflavimicrobium daqui]|jgi:small acid-soluble spore protein H (minor)|uniref:H-type small acid-soluble spore protein n=1 Tax=Thermoflavimicrobium daqui TaxID=2137476 RepID=A0A364K8U4_9BACL|nr:H-type small acid-soluble spore protein [Thermoflavimicrobium daqui]RAL26717.1 H-type small acid-soluble spore protein [Thermoflavimicrobium daqui]